MKRSFLYLAAVLVAAVSCQSELDSVLPGEEGTMSEGVWFKVPSLIDGDSQDTKALYPSSNGFDFKWADGDHIAVYSGEGGKLDASVKTASSSTPDHAIFTGSGFSLTENEDYYAFYPYAEGTEAYTEVPVDFTGQTLSCTNDDGSITNFTAKDFCWATATCSASGSASFNFKHLCAFVKMELSLPDEVVSVSKVTIGTSESIFTTTGKVDLSKGEITSEAHSNTIVLTNDTTPLAIQDKKMTAYFALAPIDISKRAIYIIAEGNTESATNKKYSVTFIPGTYVLEAGKVYTTLFKRELVENNDAATLSAALQNGGTVLASEYQGTKYDLSSSSPITLNNNVGLVVDADLIIPTGSITVGSGVIFTIMGDGTTVTQSATKAGDNDDSAPVLTSGNSTHVLTIENGGIVNSAGAVAIDGASVKLADSATADDSYAIENQRIVRVYSGVVNSSQNIVKNTKGSYTNTVEINNGTVTAAKNVIINEDAVAQATSKVNIAGGTVEATDGAIVKNLASSIDSNASSQVTISDGEIKVGEAVVTNTADSSSVKASKNKVSISGGNITLMGTSTSTAAVVKNTENGLLCPSTPATGAEITGGTFTSDGETKVDVSSNNTVPAGYEQDDSGEVKADKNQVAQIGTAVYTTLAAAYDAAEDGATIKLLQDQTSDRIDVAKNITINLNGCTLTSSAGYKVMFGIKGGKTLTIDGTTDNSKINGSIMVSSSVAGNLTVNGGTYINESYVPFYVNGSCDEGNVWKISNATIGGDDYEMGIYQAGRCTTTLTDCTISGSKTGIEVRAGSMTLKDCTVSGSTTEFTEAANANGSTVEGAAVAVSQHSPDYPVSLTIDGGSYTGYYALYEKDLQNKTGTITLNLKSGKFTGSTERCIYSENCTKFISGGYYNPVEPDDSYIADGYKATSIGDDTYRIEAAAVAQIGKVTYATLAKAIAAVPTTGEETTITMIADATIDVDTEISGNKKVILELNGKTISGSASGKGSNYYLMKIGSNADVNIQDTPGNGKITFTVTDHDTGYGNEYCTIYNCGGKLTIESGTIENLTIGGAAYAVTTSSNAWGTPIETTFNLTGGTLTSPEGDGALRIYQNNSTQSSSHAVNISGGTIADSGLFIDTFYYKTSENVDIVINITGGKICNLVDLKLRHKNVVMNISGGEFDNVEFRVRKGDSPTYFEDYGYRDGAFVNITGGKFLFKEGTVFKKSKIEGNDWGTYNPYSIKGGYYNYDTFTVDSGYKFIKNTESETKDYAFKVVEDPNVAQVGDTKYTSLAEALNATASGQTCELLRNVDLKDVAWTPVSGFAGTFDGKGFTISNLTVSEGSGNIGLFASTSGATVKNLTISGASISGNSMTGENIGILAGDAGVSTFTNINITNSTIKTEGKYVGAIAGTCSSTITYCSVTGCEVKGKDQVGAAVGYQWCNGVWNCTATDNTVEATEERAGCLIGKLQCSSGNDSYFNICDNKISGTAKAPDYAGGVAAQIMGDMSNYEIRGNSVDATLTADKATSPIAVLRNDNGMAFDANLAANITGNSWTETTLKADRYTYTCAGCENTFANQIVWNGTPKSWSDYAASGYSIPIITDPSTGVKTVTISNAAELALFAKEQKDGTHNGENKTGGHTIVNLTANIDLDSYVWEPIVMECVDFNGNGHTVSNLYVASEGEYVGLFGEASISSVSDLTIDGAYVSGSHYVAAIAGHGLCGIFTNCTVKNATLLNKVKDNDNGDKTGAICGYLSGEPTAEATNCTVTNCSISGYRDLGSVVGMANGTSVVTNNTVNDCALYNIQTSNPEKYTDDSQYNIHEIVGRVDGATIGENPFEDVTIIRVKN